MIVLLLLGASLCVGFSGDQEVHYGDTLRMMLYPDTHSIDFRAKHSSYVSILWKNDTSTASDDSRHRVMGLYYVISNLTQRDSGRYTMRDKDQSVQFMKSIKVTENKSSYTLNPGQNFNFTFDLEPNSCNIYFLPKSNKEHTELKTEIVRQGRLQEGLDQFECGGFHVLKPCGILNKGVPVSCNGRFEVWDLNNNKALEVVLKMEQIPNDAIYFYIVFGASVVALLCCCCVRCYCCRKRSSEKHGSETAAGPAVNLSQYGYEQAGPGQAQLSQPSGTVYLTVPSYTPNNPLIAAPAEKTDAETVPLCSDNEPRFELKGIPSALPLSSDSTDCHVYTSEKLNFR